MSARDNDQTRPTSPFGLRRAAMAKPWVGARVQDAETRPFTEQELFSRSSQGHHRRTSPTADGVHDGYTSMSVALTDEEMLVAGPQGQGVERGDGDLGGERQLAVDADADTVAEPVDVGDRAASRRCGHSSRRRCALERRSSAAGSPRTTAPAAHRRSPRVRPTPVTRTPSATLPATRLTPTRSAT